MTKKLRIIGAGLAGSEAAWQAANRGLQVELIEMRPQKMTPAHQSGGCAELVCSNSFRSDDAVYNAVGLLHEEMRRCDSLIMKCADLHKVPAGGALAVDREAFSDDVTKRLNDHPNITIKHDIIEKLPLDDTETLTIVATGPLTDSKLAEHIKEVTGQDSLAFFDAIAPIIYKESIDFDKAWFQSRYDKVGPIGDGKDYINCAMNEEEYKRFYNALMEAEKTEFKDWEKDTPYFEACLPIEVMAERGIDTLRYGPMKPVGLTQPGTEGRHYAVAQLRQDNKMGELYNMVGFQTKLKYGAQKDVFRLIPGLEKAEFARLGGIHRNMFMKSPELLTETLALETHPHIRFAGQMTGCEGYVESSAVGLMAGRFASAEALGKDYVLPNTLTAMGALLHHITDGGDAKHYQPMNINFGLFTPLDSKTIIVNGRKRKMDKKTRAQHMTERATPALNDFMNF